MSDLSDLGTIDQYARHRGVHTQTVRVWIRKGYFPIYKAAGRRGALIKRDEADAALAALPEGAILPGHGTYGPNADVRTLGGAS